MINKIRVKRECNFGDLSLFSLLPNLAPYPPQSVSVSVSQSVSVSVSQSVSVSVYQSVSQSVYQSVSQSVSQCISQSVSVSVSQSAYRTLHQPPISYLASQKRCNDLREVVCGGIYHQQNALSHFEIHIAQEVQELLH